MQVAEALGAYLPCLRVVRPVVFTDGTTVLCLPATPRTGYGYLPRRQTSAPLMIVAASVVSTP